MVARRLNTLQALLIEKVEASERSRFVAANPSARVSLLNLLAETRSHDLLVAQYPKYFSRNAADINRKIR